MSDPSAAPQISVSLEEYRELQERYNNLVEYTRPLLSSRSDGSVTPGRGAPPDREGLYWVQWLGNLSAMLLAVVEGDAPFMRVRLIDPFTSDTVVPSASLKIKELTWLGEIERPVTYSAGGAR